MVLLASRPAFPDRGAFCPAENLERVLTGRMPLTGKYEPSPNRLTRDHVELYERSDGTEGATQGGRPIIVLTTMGARSGKLRKVALMRVEHDGAYAVVASLGGAPRNPVWYQNILSHPRVELQDGPNHWDMTAREVRGEEKALWWERAVETWPAYADYQLRTRREIPVLVLERADAPA